MNIAELITRLEDLTSEPFNRGEFAFKFMAVFYCSGTVREWHFTMFTFDIEVGSKQLSGLAVTVCYLDGQIVIGAVSRWLLGLEVIRGEVGWVLLRVKWADSC